MGHILAEHLSPRRYERIARSFLDEPWAILPGKLEAIADFIALKAQGGTLTEAEISAIRAAAPPMQGQREGAIAVMPVFGTLRNRLNLMTEMSGGTSVELMSKQFAALVRNPDVSAIILDIDSPGGAVSGIPEFAAQIFAARDVKPVIAVADTLAASAAYWLGTAASEFVAAPSAEVGSVGALMVHEDVSGAMEQEGRKVTLIYAGKHKVEGNPYEPLGDEAAAALQERVDAAYERFTADVARFRGVSVEIVRGERFGAGRVLSADRALQAGMVDGIATLDETIDRLMRPQGRAPLSRRAEADPIDLSAVLDRLDRIEARLPEQSTQPDAESPPRLEVDIDAVAAELGKFLKERQ